MNIRMIGFDMAKRIITISREFGSGGRFIGEEVAKNLGIAYYDKNIIDLSFCKVIQQEHKIRSTTDKWHKFHDNRSPTGQKICIHSCQIIKYII